MENYFRITEAPNLCEIEWLAGCGTFCSTLTAEEHRTCENC